MLILGKNFLVLHEEGETQRLDDTTIIEQAKYSINITRSRKKFCFSLHYNWSNFSLYANAVKLYQIKVKKSEIKPYLLRLVNVSKDLKVDNAQNCYNALDIRNIVDILM